MIETVKIISVSRDGAVRESEFNGFTDANELFYKLSKDSHIALVVMFRNIYDGNGFFLTRYYMPNREASCSA